MSVYTFLYNLSAVTQRLLIFFTKGSFTLQRDTIAKRRKAVNRIKILRRADTIKEMTGAGPRENRSKVTKAKHRHPRGGCTDGISRLSLAVLSDPDFFPSSCPSQSRSRHVHAKTYTRRAGSGYGLIRPEVPDIGWNTIAHRRTYGEMGRMETWNRGIYPRVEGCKVEREMRPFDARFPLPGLSRGGGGSHGCYLRRTMNNTMNENIY